MKKLLSCADKIILPYRSLGDLYNAYCHSSSYLDSDLLAKHKVKTHDMDELPQKHAGLAKGNCFG